MTTDTPSNLMVAPREAGPLARLIAKLRRRLAARTASRGAALEHQGAPLDPIAVRQWLWGPDFVIPGGADHVLDLVRPLRLGPGASVVDLSAGLGGLARTVAAVFGVTVVGLERDYELAQQAMARSREAGLVKRAPVSVYDPESFDLPRRRYQAALAREATYAVRDKERFLRVLMQGLKPQGRLVLTEFILARSVADRSQLGNWQPLAGRPPFPWTLERYEDCLKALGFGLRQADDITAAYRTMMIAGWTGLARRPELGRLPRWDFVSILDEAKRATRTIAAFDSGILKMVHLTADVRPG